MTMSYENNFVSKPTKNSEIRKIRKPLMEKKRRARINSSLNELKRILLDYSNIIREGSRPAKLEKADILEMTVRHLQNLHQLSRRRESIWDDRPEVIPMAKDQRTMSAVHQTPNFFLCSGSGKEEEWRGSDKRGGKTLPDDVAETPCERVRDTGVTGPSSHLSPSSLERTESPKPTDGIRCELETSCLVWRPWQGMQDS